MITCLHIYDFDGTLFRSPEQPSWWSGSNWWGAPESLTPPVVPAVPGFDWWIQETVTSAKESILDGSTFTALLTGRPEEIFGPRVRELLGQAGLAFSEVYCAETFETQEDKIEIIGRILDEHPDVKYVEMWEDRVSLIPRYREFINSRGLNVIFHRVKATPKEAGGDPFRVAARWLVERSV